MCSRLHAAGDQADQLPEMPSCLVKKGALETRLSLSLPTFSAQPGSPKASARPRSASDKLATGSKQQIR
ncbi:hypothetical protein WJX72_004809 [[Myrmecia] bisecta]|uniref:Uncharacterized protein n=1 Tax=[Myrmecia] bisecta TaxID=41462 RepID=A0AAW1PCM4_9CHLO